MNRRPSFIILCVGLILVTVVFGVRATYAPTVHHMIVGVQFVVICLASWRVGAWAIAAAAGRRREVATAAASLVMPFALFAFLAGIGPPGAGQTAAEEQLRYLILLINAILIAGGWVILREALSGANERFYSTLGFAATMIAAPMYLIFMAIMLAVVRSTRLENGSPSPWIVSLADLADLFLFFGGVLTYLATAAFAASLGRAKWLGRVATYVFVSASALAVLCLALRGMSFPDPSVAFEHWYTTIGWLAGIPAVPWMMPCALGVILLRRAGSEESSLSSVPDSSDE
jgi:hypothetical protein